MKDERKGVSKDEIMKAAKENGELTKFIKSLTKEEIARIKKVREFEQMSPGSVSYKIAVLCDPLRQNMRAYKLKMAQKLTNIKELENNIFRLKVQLKSDNIIEKMKNGLTMNKQEVESLIQKNQYLKDGEFASLYQLFGEIRAIAGNFDVAGNMIMSLEEFDKFVLDIETVLKKYGYELFGDLS